MRIDSFILEKLQHRSIINAVDRLNYLGNYKCHNNSLNYALKYPEKVKAILGCAQVFNDDGVAAHFVVKLKNGTIVDPTFGRLTSVAYSYLIQIESYTITEFKPERELVNLKKHLFSLAPWYARLFSSWRKI